MLAAVGMFGTQWRLSPAVLAVTSGQQQQQQLSRQKVLLLLLLLLEMLRCVLRRGLQRLAAAKLSIVQAHFCCRPVPGRSARRSSSRSRSKCWQPAALGRHQ